MSKILASVILLFVILSVSCKGLIMDNDERLKRMAELGLKRCVMHATENGVQLHEAGFQIRYPSETGHTRIYGEYKGRPHAWVEYLKDGRWLVEDTALGITGIPIERCKPLCGRRWYYSEDYVYYNPHAHEKE